MGVMDGSRRARRKRQFSAQQKGIRAMVAQGFNPVATVESSIGSLWGLERRAGESLPAFIGRATNLSTNQVEQFLVLIASGVDMREAEKQIAEGACQSYPS